MLSLSQIQTHLKKAVPDFPDTVVMLGSGWSKVLDKAEVETEVSYETLFDVQTTVPGHSGKLVIARISQKRVAFMVGRFHMYEGYSAAQATLPLRAFAQAGMKNLILTAAAGAINEKFKVGDFVVLSDVITLLLSLDNPLVGPQFVDMSEAFHPELRQKAIEVCVKEKIPFHEGIYCYYHGPSFETPADKMAIKILGADVVGMSAVPETIMARSLGVNVLGLAFVTNLAFVKHDHHEVLAEANKASQQMTSLLTGVLS